MIVISYYIIYWLLLLYTFTQEVDLSVVEYIGFAAGYKIMERLTREWPRFKDELDTMKFICTDFWTCIYKKQIDNLRTNHQGVYVLQDNAFRFLTNFSNGQQYLEYAPRVRFLKNICFVIISLFTCINILYIRIIVILLPTNNNTMISY